MASIFCPQCGAKNNYSLKKPNFCQSCGETFSAFGLTNSSNAATQDSYSAANTAIRRTSDGIPALSRLEYDLELPTSSKQTFEALVNNPLNPEELQKSKKINKKDYTKMSKEDYLKMSQAKCRSSRGDSKDIGDGGEE